MRNGPLHVEWALAPGTGTRREAAGACCLRDREAAERSYHYNEAIVDSPRGTVFHFICSMSGVIHFQIGFDIKTSFPQG